MFVKNFIELECDLGEGSLVTDCDFEFKAYQDNDYEILVQFDFSGRELEFSQGDLFDFVFIKTWGLPFIRSDTDQQVFREPGVHRVRIPRQVSQAYRFISEAAKATKEFILATFTMETVHNYIYDGLVAQILDMITYLQIVNFFPLMPLKSPGNVLVLFE